MSVSSPQGPYKGLVPYAEEDAEFFFGREAEREIITANLLASRLTVFYGASGVGKSSVLRAGVAHHLRQRSQRDRAEQGRAEFAVIVFRDWRDDPLAGLSAQLHRAVAPLLPEGATPPSPDPGSLVEILRAWTERLDGDLLIILDQFEEYFLYHGQEDGPGTFAVEFPRAVNRRDLRVSFLVSLREDALAQLDRFKGRIPNLFDNYLRIRHLDREAAREAIEKPLARFNDLRRDTGDPPIRIEPALADEVLDQVQSGHVLLGESGQGGIGSVAGDGDAGERIETPYLQLVMTRLWEAEVQAGSRELRLATLQELGGAERIVRTHLDKVMDALSAQERDVAARIFHHLVTPGGTKIALTAADLAYFTGLPEPSLEAVLRTLSRGDERILRSADAGYEIFHDVLAPAVLDWRRRHLEQQRQEEIRRQEQEQRDREQEQLRREALEQQERTRRRMWRVAGYLGVAFVIGLSGLTAFALSERNEAVEATRRAELARMAESDARADAENSRLRLSDERDAYAEIVRRLGSSNPALVRQAIAALDSTARQLVMLDTAVSPTTQVTPLVYIQFGGAVSRGVLEDLRSQLNRDGFPAPGTERIDRNFSNHVSYFHEEDRDLASTLAGRTRRFFEERGCVLDLNLRHLPTMRARVRRGQVEVWVHTNCPG
jgi:hypothetical protein